MVNLDDCCVNNKSNYTSITGENLIIGEVKIRRGNA